ALEILDARRMRIDALTITQADVDALLAGQPAGAVLTVQLGDGAAEVKLKRFPGEARVAVRAGTTESPLTLQVNHVRIAGIPIPGFLLDWLVRNFDPTLRLKGLPVPIPLGPIRIRPGRIEIGDPTVSSWLDERDGPPAAWCSVPSAGYARATDGGRFGRG